MVARVQKSAPHAAVHKKPATKAPNAIVRKKPAQALDTVVHKRFPMKVPKAVVLKKPTTQTPNTVVHKKPAMKSLDTVVHKKPAMQAYDTYYDANPKPIWDTYELDEPKVNMFQTCYSQHQHDFRMLALMSALIMGLCAITSHRAKHMEIYECWLE